MFDSNASFSPFVPKLVVVEVVSMLIIGALFDLLRGFSRDVVAVEQISAAEVDEHMVGGSTSMMLRNKENTLQFTVCNFMNMSYLLNKIYRYILHTSSQLGLRLSVYISTSVCSQVVIYYTAE